MIRNAQNAIKALTSLGLSLLALGIVIGLLSGGVVGLIAVGVILWLFRD